MPDTTNITDTLPDGSTVTSNVGDHDHGALDASARFGATHDTWHAESSSVPPGGGGSPNSATGVLSFDNGGFRITPPSPPFVGLVLPAVSTEVALTVNGTSVGAYTFNGTTVSVQSTWCARPEWVWLDDFSKTPFADQKPTLTPLLGQTVTLTWPPA